MPDHGTVIQMLGLIVVLCPIAMVLGLGLASLVGQNLREGATNRLCQVTIITGLLATSTVLAIMLIGDTRHEALELGSWVKIEGYHFSFKLIFDRLSIPFAILSFLLCGTIGAFAHRYMHRERGYNRFFVLYSLFVLGMVLTSLAGTIETLFAGWELVGLSSVLLVAYFHERPSPPRNGLRVWIVYRISDAALLLAAIAMHHIQGEGDFDRFLGEVSWPDGAPAVTGSPTTWVGLLLILAAAGKSGLIPFSGWLPRAMEGPTPSSAIFYGALSVHLGAFLLLRFGPLLDTSVALSVLVICLGLGTALFAYIAGGIQADIKSVLSYASLVQVGLIVAEIGFGFRYLALVHLLGNACLRTLQFIRAPTLLHDYHLLKNAIGDHPLPAAGPLEWAPRRFRAWLYRFALEGCYFDIILANYIVSPFVRMLRWFDSLEQRWTQFLSGGKPGSPKQPRTAEELS